jgi:lysophospholipase L1-like esterase
MMSVVLIGDSIRLGYQPQVQRLLAGEAEVWGPETNGGHAVNVLMHLHLWAKHRQPDLIHINCGLHDLRTDHFGGGEPLVPLPVYALYVERILRYLRTHTRAAVVWATTTPVIDAAAKAEHARWSDFDRSDADVRAYNGFATAICARLGVPVNDLEAVVRARGPETMQNGDGVHYTEAGSAILAEAVAAAIRAHRPR